MPLADTRSHRQHSSRGRVVTRTRHPKRTTNEAGLPRKHCERLTVTLAANQFQPGETPSTARATTATAGVAIPRTMRLP